jgi:N-methylhydantoinase A/oxoprolinase/acetone carboxylase beta subunit
MSDAIVVDVGGTTSDIGMLKNGFPRQANSVVEVGGVRTLFRMPDVLSLPLGGGTRVRQDPLRLGPDSVGYRLVNDARIFGGSKLTATDIAVAKGLIQLGDSARVSDLDPEICDWFAREVRSRLESGIERIKTQAGDLPLIAVGGGSFLVPSGLRGVSDVIHVPHHDVANAIGASISQIGGEVDQVFSNMGREEAIGRATEIASARAIDAGAGKATLEIVEIEDLPLAYLPGSTRRVRVRVVGELN